MDAQRLLATRWKPAERRIYKPQNDNSGTCLKIQLRLEPQFATNDKGAEYVDRRLTDGGLFLELVPQGPEKTPNGEAKFLYDSPKRVIALLGTPDVSGMLAAYRDVRLRGLGVPAYLLKRSKGTVDPMTVSLFHQTPGGGNCVIQWTFSDNGSRLRISRAADHAQTITLTLGEELVLVDLLERALTAFNDLGL